MTGEEAVDRFGVENIYRVARRRAGGQNATSARLRARDLIPPPIMWAEDDEEGDRIAIEIGSHRRAGIATLQRSYVAARAARWWDEWAGPLIRRLQVAMREKLQAHVARREEAMWADHRWKLKVEGEEPVDARTGEAIN